MEQADNGASGRAALEPPKGRLGHSVSVPDALGVECEHHYGITTHDFRDGMTAGELTYWLIRNAWHVDALTDDNHTWEVVEHDAPAWSYVRIIKNEKSPRFALCPSWYADGPDATWFTQEYRVATITNIAWEAAEHLTRADKWDADAVRQRDTIRGRKARLEYTRWAESERRIADLVRSRWPGAYGLPRTEWQNHIHEHRVPAQAISAGTAETQAQGDSPPARSRSDAPELSQGGQDHA